MVAFIFDFINGFHDSANSIATVVGTRVLTPLAAVVWAAFFNFVAAFTVGTAVAKTVGSGMIDVCDRHAERHPGGTAWRDRLEPGHLVVRAPEQLVACAASAGMPGAAVAKAGFGAIIPAGWTKTLIFIFAVAADRHVRRLRC